MSKESPLVIAVAKASDRGGSVMVEFVLLLGMVVLPVLIFLLAEFNGGGPGLLHALRDFLARILIVVGMPLL